MPQPVKAIIRLGRLVAFPDVGSGGIGGVKARARSARNDFVEREQAALPMRGFVPVEEA
jgi:hypothetical protein